MQQPFADRRSSLLGRAIAIAVLIGLCTLGLVTAAEPSFDERFLAGLRQRRLFELAEKYCREQLAHSDLAGERRAELVIELSRTLAEHAVQAAQNLRPALWREARDVVDKFARDDPRNPRLLVARVQGALALLAQGELARQELQVSDGDPAAAEAARGAIRPAVAALKSLEAEIATLAIRRGQKPEPGELSAPVLLGLQANVQYQLARAFRNQALCYPAGSADRTAALTQSEAILSKLAVGDAAEPLTWPSRFDLALSLRLRDDLAGASRKLDEVAAASPPAAFASRLRAEQLRVRLAQGRIDEALAMAQSLDSGRSDPELDLALVEVYLAAATRAAKANDAKTSAALQQQAAEQVQRLERRHGPYWMRRGETLLARSVSQSPAGENVDALARAAASFFRSGKLDEALAAYDRAAARAAADGNRDKAFQFALTAATIEHERKHTASAVERFRRAALANPEHPQAAAAHQWAIFDAGEAAQAVEMPDLAAYQELLREHLTRWPMSPTAGQAAWQLANLLEHERKWDDAIAVFQRVPADHSQHPAAVAAIGRCALGAIDDARGANHPTRDIATGALRYFENLIAGPNRQLPERWTAAAREAAAAAARVELAAPTGTPDVESWLRGALAAADATPEWKAAAGPLLVSLLVARGDLTGAQRALGELSGGAPGDLLTLIDQLGRDAAATRPELKPKLAALQWDALALVEPRRRELSAADALRLDRAKALTLVALGRRNEALSLLEQLAKKLPDDGAVQEELAALLLDSRDPDTIRRSLVAWRAIEEKSRPGSPRWFRAHLAMAQGYFALGNKPHARAIIKLTETTHADLGGAAMKARFMQLLAKCEK